MPLKTSPIARRVIGLAIEVHRELGPGLLESAYERCLCYELTQAEIAYDRQVIVPVTYKMMRIDCGFRADLVVDRRLLVELKSVDRLLPIHQAQVITYLRLTGLREALLMNFNVLRLADGLRSLLN